MYNFGYVTPKITLLNKLPFYDDRSIKDFNICANHHYVFANGIVPPSFVDFIYQEEVFAAIIPRRRKEYIDNYIVDGENANVSAEAAAKSIVWQVSNDILGKNSSTDIVIKEMGRAITKKSYALLNKSPGRILMTVNTPTNTANETAYFQVDNYLVNKTFPDPTLQDVIGIVNEAREGEVADEVKDEDEQIHIKTLKQSNPVGPLWWAIETKTEFEPERGAYLTINRNQSGSLVGAPFIVWTFGTNDENGKFSLILRDNVPSYLYDYKYKNYFSLGESVIRNTDNDIEVSFVNLKTRLVIWVNDNQYIYERIRQQKQDETESGNNSENKDTKFEREPIDIAGGKHLLFGFNTNGNISLSNMGFSSFGAVSFPIPELSGKEISPGSEWQGIRKNGDFDGSVFTIQTDENEEAAGIDCEDIVSVGLGPTDIPDIYFGKRGKGRVAIGPIRDGYYYMILKTENKYDFPVFYQIRGGIDILTGNDENAVVVPNLENYAVSITESFESEDYHSISKTVELTLYNPGGLFDSLKTRQTCIQLSWGRGGGDIAGENAQLSFTGVSVNVESTQEPGNETLRIRYEDYMYVLKSQPIVHQLAFDGMWDYAALGLLARLAGFSGIVNDRSTIDYFLPAGNVYSEPKLKYEAEKPILDCMVDIASKYESYFYIDPGGQIIFNQLEGGLFALGSVNSQFDFSSVPSPDNPASIIGTYTKSTSIRDTVNIIVGTTVGRESRNYIVLNEIAKNNKLLHKKVALYTEAALGSESSLRTQVEKIGARAFSFIESINFQVVGGNYDIVPFGFITVDGASFRVFGLTKTYDAASNNLTMDIEARWGA